MSPDKKETFDPKPFLERLTAQLQMQDKHVCAANVCCAAAETAIRYTGFIASIFAGYDIELENVSEDDIHIMSEGHQTMLLHCVSECLAFARVAENLYMVGTTPQATLKHDDVSILCAECCTCTEYSECDVSDKWADMQLAVADLCDAFEAVLVHLTDLADNEGFVMPFAALKTEREDGNNQ